MQRNPRLTKTFIGGMTLAAIGGTLCAAWQATPCTRRMRRPYWHSPPQPRR
ncbi:MAG: hypothetical protein WA899_14810 [Candidatus Sulfotelmatobacter sp.]